MSPAEPPQPEDLGAEFPCSCSIEVSPEWSIALWQCTAGESCPQWRLITGALEQCIRQLQLHALVRGWPL